MAVGGDECGRRDRAGDRVVLAQSRTALAGDDRGAALRRSNILFAYRYLPESHDAKARLRTRGGRAPIDAVIRVAGVDIGQPYARLIWMYSVGIGAFYGVNALIILYLSRHFDVTENSIGFFFMYMGGLSIIFRLFLLGPAVDKFGEVRTARLGALSLGVRARARPAHGVREAHGAAATSAGCRSRS